MRPYRLRFVVLEMMVIALCVVVAGADDDSGELMIGGRSVDGWIAALGGSNRSSRVAAASALGLLGPKAKAAVPALTAAVEDPKSGVQTGAMIALGEIGPDAAAAAPALARKLADNGFSYSYGPPYSGSHVAADALVAIGPAAVPALSEALESDAEDGRGWAASALEKLGPSASGAVRALERMVKADGAQKARSAVDALGAIGPAAVAATPTLHAAYDTLKHDEDDSALLAAMLKIGAPPSPGMIRELDDPDPERRFNGAQVLRDFGPKAKSAVPRLVPALGDSSPYVRVSAASALARIDPADSRALPVLTIALDSPDLGLLETAINAIEELGPRAAAAAPKLKRVAGRDDLEHGSFVGLQLESTIGRVQSAAAAALVAVAPDSREGVEALMALAGKEGDAQYDAIGALGRLGPKALAAATTLDAVSREGTCFIRVRAIMALTRIDPEHKAILPNLIALLSNPDLGSTDSDEKTDVIIMLGRMGPKARPAVPALVRVLEEEEKTEGPPIGRAVEEEAAKALGRIGPSAEKAILPLARALRTIGEPAADALAFMGPAARQAVPELIAQLKSDEKRWSAARVLGAIGPDARDSVPDLVAMLDSKNPLEAATAGSALLRIDPSTRRLVEARLEARLAKIRRKDFYPRAALSGALGRRTAEADGLTRQTLRDLRSELAEFGRAMESDGAVSGLRLDAREWLLGIIQERLNYLAELGVGASDALADLAELTHHADPWVRRSAVEALKQIAPK